MIDAASGIVIAGIIARRRLQRRNAVANSDLGEKLPIRVFPTHDAVDQVECGQIRNNVVAPPYEAPFGATRNELTLELAIALQEEGGDERSAPCAEL
jgi:hypothetical protein